MELGISIVLFKEVFFIDQVIFFIFDRAILV